MKLNAIRFVAITLALIFVLPTLLSSCGYKAIPPSEEDLVVVGHVESFEVKMDELRFVTETYRKLLISRYGEGIFEGEERETYLAMLKELVYSNITANYAVLILCSDVKINLGEEAVLERVEERMAEIVSEMGGVSKYKQYLKENKLTDRLLRFNTEVDLLQNELLYVYVEDISLIENDDEKIYDIIMDEFISVRHVFVSKKTDNAYEKITRAYDALSNGRSFSYVMNDYNEDTDMTTDGLCIPRGYMIDSYDTVAFSLKAGQVSSIIECEQGYYIIERSAISVLTVMQRFDYLKDLYQTYAFYDIIDNKQETLVFVPTEAGEQFISQPF